MTQAVQNILLLIGNLSVEERIEVAYACLDSIRPCTIDDVAWEEELDRRINEIRSGRAVGKPAALWLAESQESKP